MVRISPRSVSVLPSTPSAKILRRLVAVVPHAGSFRRASGFACRVDVRSCFGYEYNMYQFLALVWSLEDGHLIVVVWSLTLAM